MAIGGALRAALRAGNWARTAVESRRRARALADLNARGGIRGPVMDTGEGLAARGFDVFDGGGGFAIGSSSPNRPRFNVIRDPATGNRQVYANPPGFRANPIEAPYEGFRVWPRGTRSFFGLTGDMPAGNVAGPFMGRGVPNFSYRADGANPAIPRAFGGTFNWPAGGAVNPPGPRHSRFFFDDFV